MRLGVISAEEDDDECDRKARRDRRHVAFGEVVWKNDVPEYNPFHGRQDDSESDDATKKFDDYRGSKASFSATRTAVRGQWLVSGYKDGSVACAKLKDLPAAPEKGKGPANPKANPHGSVGVLIPDHQLIWEGISTANPTAIEWD